jgi:hypothetical protein
MPRRTSSARDCAALHLAELEPGPAEGPDGDAADGDACRVPQIDVVGHRHDMFEERRRDFSEQAIARHPGRGSGSTARRR